METYELGKSVYNQKAGTHLNDRKEKIVSFIKNGASTSKSVLKNLITLLKENPKESAPILFLGVLGFFCGAGTEIGEKTWYDIDGGFPDLDWKVGEITGVDMLGHRSPFFHSIISAAVLETMVFSSVKAVNIIHSNLPDNHDPFWDNVITYEKWAEALVTGACAGIAYHLLIDGNLGYIKEKTVNLTK